MARKRRPPKRPTRPPQGEPATLRIIGGHFRGRKLLYSGDRRVRPMKDRVREAVFNLVGPAIREKHAIDLFAGTGALALEAISRGAAQATLIEQHFPTAEITRRNVTRLGVEDAAQVVTSDVFIWLKRGPELGPRPWVVFCSPPWDFFVERADAMQELIGGLMRQAPRQSIFAVEADKRFDFRLLPHPDAWDIRHYPPVVLGIYRTQD